MQVAWLNTAPEIKDAPLVTRRKQYESAKLEIEMPPCLLPHLINYLFSISPGAVATFQEIASWQTCVGVHLSGWEAQTIHDLSIRYINQQQESTKADCPPPWDGAAILVRRMNAIAVRNNNRKLASL
jgi:hypothetical protein